MDVRQNFRKTIPYATAVALFMLLAALYFLPQFEGRTLPMHDVLQYKGMSADIRAMQQSRGEDPQWTGNAFGGMPAYMINMLYPAQIVRGAAWGVTDALGTPASMLFVAMLAFWGMLLMMRADPWAAIAPAVAYGFSTYSILIIGAGHLSKMWAFAYAPLVIGGVWYTLRGRRPWLGLFLTALFAALELAANHVQITWYFVLVVAALWISELVRAVKSRRMKSFFGRTAMLVGAAVLAVGANFAPLYYTARQAAESTRGGSELRTAEGAQQRAEDSGLDLQYATAWSYGRTESFNLFIPDLMGGASDRGFDPDGEVADALRPYGRRDLAVQLPAYWGDQPYTAGPTYLGAVMVFLAVLGLFVLPGHSKWWVAIVSLLGLLLAWGSNLMWFTELAFHVLPGYNKFRAVSTALVILQWSVPLLAAWALMALWHREIDPQRLRRGLLRSLYVTGGVALFFLLFGGVFFSFIGTIDAELPEEVAAAMRAERAAMLRLDALRSLVFCGLTFALVWSFVCGRAGRWMLTAGMCVLVLIDMVPVDLRYLSHDDFVFRAVNEPQPTEADRQILADPEPGFRVADFTLSSFNDATASAFHRSIGGYHAAKLSRYQDLIDHHLTQMTPGVYDMLNVKYFIVPDPQSGRPAAQPNPTAFGPAWFVDEIRWVEGPQQEIDALGTTDLRRTAVVDRSFAPLCGDERPGADSTASIRLVEYRPNYLCYETSSADDGLAVFSEIYYPAGWTVTLDGVPAEYFRANYVLRAMRIPAGLHRVEFSFRAPHFAAVEGVTLVSSLVVLIGVLGAVVVLLIRNRKRHESQTE